MEKQIAVFFDYDNLMADPLTIIDFLKKEGRIVLIRCYMDSNRDLENRTLFYKANVEIIDRPRYTLPDKNGTDIHLALDALETALTIPNINIFVILSGDSDYLPLVSKLKKYGKMVYIVSSKKNGSKRLKEFCDRFYYYENIVKIEEVENYYEADELGRKKLLKVYLAALDLIKTAGEIPDSTRILQTMRQISTDISYVNFGFRNDEEIVAWCIKEVTNVENEEFDEISEDVSKTKEVNPLLLEFAKRLVKTIETVKNIIMNHIFQK